MKAYVSTIMPHHAGFGQYQRSEESEMEGDWSSVEEYAAYAASNSSNIISYAIDPEVAEMGDGDGEAMAEAIRGAMGKVIGGHDTLVAFCLGRDPYTHEWVVVLESVRVE